MNSIYSSSTLPFGAYAFDQVQIADFRSAFREAIALKRAEVDAIIEESASPTFANTILALERCGEQLEWVSGMFYNLLHAEATDELMEISQELSPEISALSSYISLSEPLFARVRSVWEQREELDLDEEDARLLQRTWESFSERGAALDPKAKERLRQINQELSELSLRFGQNNLKDQQRYSLHITEPAQVEGIPSVVLATAAELAQSQGLEGWCFTLAAPSFFPFITYCPDRELRQEIYLAKMSLGAKDDEYDNREIIRHLANLRLEYAQILGASSYAHKTLSRRMAATPEAVYALLDELLAAYKPVAERELTAIAAFASDQGAETPLQAWDWSYWAERYKQSHYDLDEEQLRPYFELGQVTRAVFALATTLYGISFHERRGLPVYHPDVQVYEVRDRDDSYLGLLYTDFFPRSGKQSGAWMNNLQEQYHDASGVDHRPHIVLVMNFTPPTADRPALLTPSEVRTFLHEFGHALHGMFAACRYSSLSGTNVVRDFVELPSQLMENWLDERSWLETFALHYETQQALPLELLDRMERARHFLVGYAACRQLSFGYLDMAWHGITEPLPEDLDAKAFEEAAWSRAVLLPASPSSCLMSSSFGHIFSGGYSAGYYGYKWAEVLDADAFAAFQVEGIFSAETAERFRQTILSQGDKRDAALLYQSFRGKAPSIAALLRRDGLQP